MLQKEAQPDRFNPFRRMDPFDKVILQKLADGNSYQEVGHYMGISVFKLVNRINRTVDAYGVLEKEGKGYVQYTHGQHALIKLIQAGVMSGDLTPEMPEGPTHYLSQREHEVVREKILGKSHQEIAEELGLPLETIDSQASLIHKKIGYRNVLHLAARIAYREKLGM